MYDNQLVEKNLRVWWDVKCLEPGVPWEKGFCEGLLKSRIFMPVLSRGAINTAGNARQNFSLLTAESHCDNVLLEYRLALELQQQGLVERIYPVCIGDASVNVTAGITSYAKYFDRPSCHPNLEPVAGVVVKAVESKLAEHLEGVGLGSPMLEPLSVKKIVDLVTINQQGKIVEVDTRSQYSTAWHQMCGR